jgi:prepilin-type N-terminal cleavage/methylation domain-containing protein
VTALIQKEKLAQRMGVRGFTLLEIIVALALVAIAVVVAIQLFSANLRAIASSEGHVKAAANAEAVMRSIITDEDFPNSAATAGTLDIYRYETSATKIDEERNSALNVDLYRVDVGISWREGTRDKSITLSGLKLVERKI